MPFPPSLLMPTWVEVAVLFFFLLLPLSPLKGKKRNYEKNSKKILELKLKQIKGVKIEVVQPEQGSQHNLRTEQTRPTFAIPPAFYPYNLQPSWMYLDSEASQMSCVSYKCSVHFYQFRYMLSHT